MIFIQITLPSHKSKMSGESFSHFVKLAHGYVSIRQSCTFHTIPVKEWLEEVMLQEN